MQWIKAIFIGLILIGLSVLAVFFIWLAPVGAAYSAKVMCSAIFVNGLTSTRAREIDVLADNNPLLSLITTNVDLRNQAVSAHAFGFRKRFAIYRPNLGCTLADSPEHIAQLRNSTPVMTPVEPRPLLTTSLPADVDRRVLNSILFDAMDEPGLRPERRTRAVVILHDGKVVAERYAAGITAETPLPGWSMTKSVFNAILGRMRFEGMISDLQEPVLINEWQAEPGDPRATINYDELLRMRSGLEFDESYANPLSDVVQMLFIEPAAAGFAVSKPLENTPGSEFSYNSGASNILSAAIRNLSGSRSTYLSRPTELLFRPLGMSSAVIETDPDGYFVASSFMHASARDWAKIGQLFLQDGVWNGERLLPEGWVGYSTSPAAEDPNGLYGAHWWIDLPGSRNEDGSPRTDVPPLPEDAFFALGHDGQSLTVIPSRNVVVVRFGVTRNRDAFDLRKFIADLSTVFPEKSDRQASPADSSGNTTAEVNGG
ncbi:class C beta-lactamase-related serine hydrolase [Thalassospira tepidiphila]|uniref:serine hydrolase domain-containing protein n=1 Tax=Thalassospira tepidiphila TaxID=393657 RepID=UPI001BCCA02A|nr:serine hydrolase [Thalassospira tepidiphila]MBS8275454.1 class C beta-lactamase-related serine hydrolase [Thalassospira tepidiphila]